MKFVEKTHRYIEGDAEFLPVTYFLKTFQEKVDWDAIAEKKAKKDGVSKEELLKQWEVKRDKAAAKGTAFHKRMEEQYQDKGVVEIDGIGYGVKWFDTIDGIKEDPTNTLEDGKIYTEKMIWSYTYKICGTADLVEVIDGKIHVKDYKTNEKLEFESYRHPNPKIGKRKLEFPLSHLDDCNYNVYQLQLNTYMYMLLQHNRNLKLGSMTILHVVYNEDGSEKEVKEYPVANLQKEVKNMLMVFKNKQ